MGDIPDIDIDVASPDLAIAPFADHIVAASQITKIHDTGNLEQVRHNSGLYLQHMPKNPLNGLAAYPYKEAEALGFYKLDILHNSVYQNVESMAELRRLLQEPIEWWWFKHRNFVVMLFHFGNFVDTVVQYKPQSILDLACLVALKMPGKRYLIGEPWEVLHRDMWKPETKGAMFKKSHSFAYAMVAGLDARIKAKKFFEDRLNE